MTERIENVYVEETALVAGPKEKNSLYAKYFDKIYKDYNLDKSFELSEIKMIKESINILLKKAGLSNKDISLVIGGDLSNQLCATSFGIENKKIPFLGVFSACATSAESAIIASEILKQSKNKRILCVTSSHNLAAEKQFRYPVEYGYTKPKTSGFTSTGASSILLTNKKTKVKVTSYTIGTITNMKIKDPNNLGAAMAPAAADTIYKHLINLNIKEDYYDLILTGDLGVYGKKILKDYMKESYNITLKNYNDCGAMLYDLKKNSEITSGGSGPVCSTLINYAYIYHMLKENKLKRVLLVPTGALFSPITVYQKQSILGIAHAFSLESVQ